MILSDCLFINHLGILLYRGRFGATHEVIGGSRGFLLFRRYE